MRAPRRYFWPSPWDMADPRLAMISQGMVHDALGFYQAQRAYFGVEFRDPTHDLRLVEFCLGLPNAQFARQGQNRMLVRRGLRGLLPEALRLRRDQGSQLGHWPLIINLSYAQMKQEWSVLREHSAVQELINTARVTSLLESWPGSNLRATESIQEYRMSLLRSFFVARFLFRAILET